MSELDTRVKDETEKDKRIELTEKNKGIELSKEDVERIEMMKEKLRRRRRRHRKNMYFTRFG